MGRCLKLDGGFFWLNSLIDGIGRGSSRQGKSVAVIGECFERVRANFRMEMFPVIFAMDEDAQSAVAFRVSFRRLARQASLRDFPEVDLVVGAERGLGADGSAARRRGHGIDFPCTWIELTRRRLGDHHRRAQSQNGCKSHDRLPGSKDAEFQHMHWIVAARD